jgi:arginyl-tRNA synthetase
MSTLHVNGLQRLLRALSVDETTFSSDSASGDVLANPLDVFRSVLADLLANILACDPQSAYNSIQWPNNIFNGDLSVTLPKLCPGRKPDETSSELVNKVDMSCNRPAAVTNEAFSFQKIMYSSTCRCPRASTGLSKE